MLNHHGWVSALLWWYYREAFRQMTHAELRSQRDFWQPWFMRNHYIWYYWEHVLALLHKVQNCGGKSVFLWTFRGDFHSSKIYIPNWIDLVLLSDISIVSIVMCIAHIILQNYWQMVNGRKKIDIHSGVVMLLIALDLFDWYSGGKDIWEERRGGGAFFAFFHLDDCRLIKLPRRKKVVS